MHENHLEVLLKHSLLDHIPGVCDSASKEWAKTVSLFISSKGDANATILRISLSQPLSHCAADTGKQKLCFPDSLAAKDLDVIQVPSIGCHLLGFRE